MMLAKKTKEVQRDRRLMKLLAQAFWGKREATVICTPATTILAMIPLALSRGEGSEIWVPFAVTVIGGLAVGTVITLVLMPSLYSVFEGRGEKS